MLVTGPELTRAVPVVAADEVRTGPVAMTAVEAMSAPMKRPGIRFSEIRRGLASAPRESHRPPLSPSSGVAVENANPVRSATLWPFAAILLTPDVRPLQMRWRVRTRWRAVFPCALWVWQPVRRPGQK